MVILYLDRLLFVFFFCFFGCVCVGGGEGAGDRDNHKSIGTNILQGLAVLFAYL